MKSINFYLVIVFLGAIELLNAQKPETFYNYDFQKINKIEFESTLKQKGYSFNQYTLDDQIAKILYQRKTYGKLNDEEYKNLKDQLNKIEKLNNDFIIIIYHPGKDNCNGMEKNSTWNIFDKDYLKKVNKLTENNHFWIYKNDENLKYYYPKKINWQKDQNQFIEKLFYKMHYPCSSSTVIDKKGNFISILGEFGKQEVIENIKELKQ